MDENIAKKLQILFDNFKKALPSKLHNIEIAWQMQLQVIDFNEMQKLHCDIHGLCGSAGTYGFIELGKTARKIEILLKNILDRKQITNNEQKEITIYVSELNSLLNVFSEKVVQATNLDIATNKLIYILEQDQNIVQEITENLKNVGYQTISIKDLNSLEAEIKLQAPIAVVIDTKYLDKNNKSFEAILKQQENFPFQLFCILAEDGISDRLKAIRIGCDAFFPRPIDIPSLTQTLNHKCNLLAAAPYKILIIDDLESLAEYYKLILNQAGMIANAITNPLELLKAIDSFKPDLLLMDIYMPECSGLELSAILRLESKYAKIPIIFLSTEADRNKQLSAISLGGGDDFLMKPIAPQHLISAVRSRAKRASILNYFMSTDSLTGLLNHESIIAQLNIEISRALQKNTSLSFIMLDVDNFKKINDTFGHAWGDEVLKKISTLLQVRLRSVDLVGRYGGEEFAIILPGANAKDSEKISNDLRRQFSKFRFTIDQNTSFSATFSAGISSFSKNKNANTMIVEADESLYEAKRLGKNRVVIFGFK